MSRISASPSNCACDPQGARRALRRTANKPADLRRSEISLAYLRRCVSMVRHFGYELRPCVERWLEAGRHPFRAKRDWQAEFSTAMVSRCSACEKANLRSEFLYVSNSELRAPNSVSVEHLMELQHRMVRRRTHKPCLICRPSETEAGTALRRIRELQQDLSWRAHTGAPWVVGGCEYLAGTPEQLAEWSGNLRAAGLPGVYLNFFD